MTDIIVIGGGTAGCVASQLHQRRPSLSVLLIEAGPDAAGHVHVDNPAGAAFLHGSDLDSKYMTVPEKHTDGKLRYNCAMNGISGGTITIIGTWSEDWNIRIWLIEG
jgi:choline dehydrogenase-like flavoprotein